MTLSEILKAGWDRLPKLPRTWRIVRNLVLSAAVMVGIIVLLGWPTLKPYKAFQRAEAAYLLTPSTHE